MPAIISVPGKAMVYNISRNGKNAVVVQPDDQQAVRMNIYEYYDEFPVVKAEIEQDKMPPFDKWEIEEKDGGVYSVKYPDGIYEYRFVYLTWIKGKEYRCDWDLIAELKQNEAEAFYNMAKSLHGK